MKTVVGLSAASIGLIAGGAEAASYAIKLFSGVLSDYTKKRKAVVLVGVVCVFISRPLLALFPTLFGVMVGRFLERIGNGIQATPMEAWASDVSGTLKQQAVNFSLKRSLGFLGSFLGAWLVSYFMSNESWDYQKVFLCASFPVLGAVLLLAFFTKEPHKNTPTKRQTFKMMLQESRFLPKEYYYLLGLTAVISFIRSLEVFIPLLAIDAFQLQANQMGYVYMLLFASNSMFSMTTASIFKKFGKINTLKIGITCLALSCTLFFSSISGVLFWLGILFWGAYQGILQTVFLILISRLVKETLRASAFGLYYLVCAIFLALGSVLLGCIAQKTSYSFLFCFCGVLSLGVMLFLKKKGEAYSI